MKLTRGQKNAINSTRWRLFIHEVQKKANVTILCTFKAGVNSSFSYRPGGEGLGWDDPGAVARYVRDKLCAEIDLPQYGAPYTQEEIENHPKA